MTFPSTPLSRVSEVIEGMLSVGDADHALVFVPGERVPAGTLAADASVIVCTTDHVHKATVARDDWQGRPGTRCAGITARPGACDPDYLFHFLKSTCLRSQPRYRRRITKRELESLRIPLPHPSEQRRTVSILDQTDATSRKCEDLLARSEDIPRTAFLDLFGHPLDPDNTLEHVALSEQCDIAYGQVRAPEDEITPQQGGIPVLRPSDLKEAGHQWTVSPATHRTPRSDSRNAPIPRGSVVFRRIGRLTAIVLARDCLAHSGLMAITPKPHSCLSGAYLRTWLGLVSSTLPANRQMIPTVSRKQLASIAVGVPDKAAVEKFNEIASSAEALRHNLRSSLEEMATLNSSLSRRMLGNNEH